MVDVSIIVPIYNAEKYLKKCIDSLVNQTKKEIEIILINDGSTDNTENIIKEYKDKRIKYFKNENQGIGKTRNFGIKKAKGNYIMFVDSDDYVELNACEELYKKAEKEKSDLVICDYYKVYNNGKKEEVTIKDFKPTTLKKYPELLLNVNLAPWNKLYKKSLIDDNKLSFVENIKYEDTPFVAEALLKAKKIGKVNKSLIYYVIHKNSETTVRDKRIFDIVKIIDIVRTVYKNEKKLTPTIDTLTLKMLMNYTIQCRYQQDSNTIKEFINEVFKYIQTNIPNYKSNQYFKERSKLKAFIEKSKTLSIMYCLIYKKVKK